MTVSHTFIATASSITFTGARPVFVDVNPDTATIDCTKLEAAITPRTKAIVPGTCTVGSRRWTRS